MERPADAELLERELKGEATEPEYFDGFRALDEIENQWIVRPGAGGEGGIARVYRVHEATTGTTPWSSSATTTRTWSTRSRRTDSISTSLNHPLIVKPEVRPHR